MDVIGLGAGGHAKVILEILQLSGGYEVIGLLDPKRELWGSMVMGTEVLGGDDLLEELRSKGVRSAFVGVGALRDVAPRVQLYESLRARGMTVVSAIHPRSIVSPTASMGAGVSVMAGAIVNPGACIGDNVIVNTGAIVEHDCIIGSHAHLASGVRMGGGARVGEGSFLGLGASVLQGVSIGARAVIGAGAVVNHDVADCCVAVGVPARVIRTIEP